jgi:hypothetical protein
MFLIVVLQTLLGKQQIVGFVYDKSPAHVRVLGKLISEKER